jgi:histidyl-tRNA synthetase
LKAIRGFEDLLPRSTAIHAYVESVARDLFHLYGYREIRTPIVEPTELFARSAGDASDVVVHKQMYTFVDPGERSNTLRPEGTAGVIRALIEHSVLSQQPLQKVWYIGPMFRYERPQKGRLRQFHQVGVESFGTHAPEADAEVIALCVALLRRLGFQQFCVKINTLGDAEDRAKYNAVLRDRIREITDGQRREAQNSPTDSLGTKTGTDEDLRPRWYHDWERLAELNPMRVFDTKDPIARRHLDKLPRISDQVGPEAAAHHKAVCDALTALGIPYEQDPDLVRGLDYYSRTVFEIVQGNIGAQSAILGGGRYDGLVAQLGGPAVPGVGMAIGLERLILSMESAGILPPDSELMPPPEDVVVCFDAAALPAGFLLAQTGRSLGRAVAFDAMARKPKVAMREAGRTGARRALIIGTGELERGTVQVKDLTTGEQTEVPRDEVYRLSTERDGKEGAGCR